MKIRSLHRSIGGALTAALFSGLFFVSNSNTLAFAQTQTPLMPLIPLTEANLTMYTADPAYHHRCMSIETSAGQLISRFRQLYQMKMRAFCNAVRAHCTNQVALDLESSSSPRATPEDDIRRDCNLPPDFSFADPISDYERDEELCESYATQIEEMGQELNSMYRDIRYLFDLYQQANCLGCYLDFPGGLNPYDPRFTNNPRLRRENCSGGRASLQNQDPLVTSGAPAPAIPVAPAAPSVQSAPAAPPVPLEMPTSSQVP